MGRRGYPLEVAAAQTCREAGARVSTNVNVRDLDPRGFQRLGRQKTRGRGRRVDLIPVCHSWSLFLHRDGTARRRAADVDGAALEAARRGGVGC